MATVYGNTGHVVQQGATISSAELTTREVRIEGSFDSLASSYHQGGSYSGDYIKSVSIQQEEGGRGIATLSLVSGITYSTLSGLFFGVTWEVDIKEVSMSLKTHPYVSDCLDIIRMWEATPEAKRVSYDSTGGAQFYYYNTVGTPTAEEPELVKVTDAKAIKYMLAATAGIESYNIYLPIVRRTSQYITRPPVSRVGTFSAPDGITLSGFTSSNFYKSADKASKAADGSWTRTEEWTYTNDRTHDWIYANT